MSQEDWKRDEPEEVRRDRTTGGTFHQTSQEVRKRFQMKGILAEIKNPRLVRTESVQMDGTEERCS